jgi:hypothetical protein
MRERYVSLYVPQSKWHSGTVVGEPILRRVLLCHLLKKRMWHGNFVSGTQKSVPVTQSGTGTKCGTARSFIYAGFGAVCHCATYFWGIYPHTRAGGRQ